MSDNGDDEVYGAHSDPAHPEFFAHLKYQLLEARKADVFYRALAHAIRHADVLDAEEREWLAQAAETPFRPPPGRPPHQSDKAKVFRACIFNKRHIKRADAVKAIANGEITGKTMEPEAAQKLYDAARNGGWMPTQKIRK